MRTMQKFSALMICTLLAAAGREMFENVRNDPTNHRREINASAYSLDACQERMDELAGINVEMTGHTQAILVSVLNFARRTALPKRRHH
jgi:hypothetical protein